MGVWLNLDGGERDDEPPELYAIADVVHVACGGHAGDAGSIRRVLRACRRDGTRVGAHPSYDDQEGFGRRPVALPTEELARQVERQCRLLASVTSEEGEPTFSAKLHGALYHAANRDGAIARACVGSIVHALGRVAIVGPVGGELERAAAAAGTPYWREAFADRATRADGSLVPRTDPGALIGDPGRVEANTRALLARGGIDTICVHADTPNAVAIARVVRNVLGPKAVA